MLPDALSVFFSHNYNTKEDMLNTTNAQRILDDLSPLLKTFREDLHRNPELSWHEFRTTDKIHDPNNYSGYSSINRTLDSGLVEANKIDTGQT